MTASSRLRLMFVVLCLIALPLGATTGCKSKTASLMGSDVPLVPDMTQTMAQNVVLAGQTAHGLEMQTGRIVMHGKGTDALAAMQKTVDEAVAWGWKLDGMEGDAELANARLSKGARYCTIKIQHMNEHVEFDATESEKDRSTGLMAVIDVGRE